MRRVAAALLAGGLAVGIGAFVAPQSDAASLAKASTKTTKPKTTKTTKPKTTKTTKTKKTKTKKTSTTKTSTTSTTSTTTPPPVGRNPYEGREQYVNVDWSAQIEKIADPISSMLHFALLDAASRPTAVWLRTVDDVATLAHHLDAANAQQVAQGRPVVVTLVLDDRPAKLCQLPSNTTTAGAITAYRQLYLDPIVKILARPEYRSLRVAVVLEPGSVMQLLVNTTASTYCQTEIVAQTTVPILQAALDALNSVPGVAVYLDGAGSARAGWDEVSSRLASVYETIVKGTAKGRDGVAGFAVNVDDYAPWREPFFTASTKVGDRLVRSSTFYQWTMAVDDESYVSRLRQLLAPYGWSSSLGVVVDTSRNGWGGTARPTKASSSSDLDTFVDASRLDRRPSRLDWCNQASAGMGARPAATPVAGVDAFVWVHNPGASDGAAPGQASDHYPYANECDPKYTGDLTEWKASGALDGAPEEGRLFPTALAQLAINAYPPLHGLDTTSR